MYSMVSPIHKIFYACKTIYGSGRGAECSQFGEMIMKMGCVVKGHFIEMPINQSLDIFMTKTINQYEHFYKSERKKSSTYCW